MSTIDPTMLSIVIAKALGGVPTVVVRGNPALLGDSISGLIKARSPDLPLISEGLKIQGTLPDGTKKADALQVLAGFDYAVEEEFRWAEQQLGQAAASTVSAFVPR